MPNNKRSASGRLQGLAGDNLAGALANTSSPYLATLIKQQVDEDNKAANTMAYAALCAVIAKLNNQSAAAGRLCHILYPLTSEQAYTLNNSDYV
ncbi:MULTISPECIES: hypothetical protein [Providencia]|nr:hypothetical protein [Providencia sp. PROV116]HEM7131362.1 hypothetical protein [Providencia rettgeri]